MMKKPNVWLATTVVASLVSLTAVASPASDNNYSADRPHHSMAGPDGEGAPFLRPWFKGGFPEEKKLNLSDDQKKKLADMRTAEEPAQKELHQKLQTAHEALRKAGDANADDVTLNRLAKDFSDLIAQQEVWRIKQHQQFLAILTAEQQQKLEVLRSEHEDLMHKRPPRVPQ